MLVGNTEKITFYYQVWTLSQNSRSTFYLYRLAIFLKRVRFLWVWHRIWLRSFQHSWLKIWHWSLDQPSRWLVFRSLLKTVKKSSSFFLWITLTKKVPKVLRQVGLWSHDQSGWVNLKSLFITEVESTVLFRARRWSLDWQSLGRFHITIYDSHKIQFILFKTSLQIT